MKTSDLYRLQREDADKLSGLLTECFSKDPLYCQLIPKRSVRKKLLPELFRCDLDEMFENCEVYADSPEVNGVIVVSDETEPCDPIRYYMAEIFCALKTAAYLIKGDLTLKTLANFIRGRAYLNSEWTGDIHQERRVHIVYFAVRPSMRKKGVATRMMRAVLDYADQNRMLTTLETHNQKNVSMYEHYGFETFEVIQKNFRLTQYCMIR